MIPCSLHPSHRLINPFLLFLLIGLPTLPVPAQTPDRWRHHEVYQPKVERGYVIESSLDGLAYNHCPTVMWFRDRWICAWNGNEVPCEGRPGLQIWMSTSRDGVTWSPPFAPFSNAELCENPFRHSKATQWQPEFIIINDQLWCFFYESSGNRAEKGCYFAQLSGPDDKWSIRRILFNGDGALELNGHKTGMIFPSQNPVQLRSGRIIVPVVLCGGRSPDAPDKAKGFWATYRHASVLYSDDLGETWNASLGCTMPGRTFCPWEPTVWEQSDGSVRMLFRNNSNSVFLDKMPRPSQFLIGALSRDGGQTWGLPEYVPIETICSRMYVAPLDGKGIWNPVIPDDDYTGRLQLMFHNDVPGSRSWSGDRRNLAIFFKRGDGFEFTAGPGFVGTEPRAVYPQHCIHNNALIVTYCQSVFEKRSIRYARLTPLPDPEKRYLLPRSDIEPNRKPRIKNKCLWFEGGQKISSRNVPDPVDKRLSLAAWVRWKSGSVLIDTRPAGLTLQIAMADKGRDRKPCLLFACDGIQPRLLYSTLTVEPDEWTYVGLDLDTKKGEAVFYVNAHSERVKITPGARPSLKGTTACIGSKRHRNSNSMPFSGGIRFMSMFDAPIGSAGHRHCYNRFATDVKRKPLDGGSPITANPLLWMDPTDADFEQQFEIPDDCFQGVRKTKVDGKSVLRFFGEGSAGVDLDENHRNRGDSVELRFRFKHESGNKQVLCTIGDADQPARLVINKNQLFLTAGTQKVLCDDLPVGTWSSVTVTTAGDKTRVQLDNSPPVEVTHTPKGTWVYLGQGYRTGKSTGNDHFVIDITSVQSKVISAPTP